MGEGGRYFSGVVETNLTGCHGGCFVEIGPGGVDYCDVIFFVACMDCSLAWLSPSIFAPVVLFRLCGVRGGGR